MDFSRFAIHTLRIWEKHGIRQARFWTTLVGESSQQLTLVAGCLLRAVSAGEKMILPFRRPARAGDLQAMRSSA